MLKSVLTIIFAIGMVFGFNDANAETPKPKTAVKAKTEVKKELQGITLYNAAKYADAKPILEKECKANSAKSCFYFGMILENGMGGYAKNPQLALEIYDKGCLLGSADSCGTLADIYLWGTDFAAENQVLASKYYDKSCNLDKKNGVNCVIAGDAYFFGDAMNKDLPRAKGFYEKGCKNEDALGCLYLADMYLYGDLGEVDFANAGKFYKQGCDLKNYKSCFELGVMYETGEGRPVNKDQAYELYDIGCQNKYGDGCYGIGILNYNGTPKRPINYNIAMENFKSACELSSSNGCFGAGHMYYWGKSGTKDVDLAKQFLEKSIKLDPKNEKAQNLLKEIKGK